MTSVHTRPLWPPPGDSPLPEPLASSVTALGLAKVHVAGLRRRTNVWRPLDPSERWPELLRQQLVLAARDESDLRGRLLAHCRLIGLSGRGTLHELGSGSAPSPATATRVLCNLIAQTDRTTDDSAMRVDPDLSDDEWLARWADLQPEPDRVADTAPTRHELLGIRLAMGELDAIDEVVRAAGGGRLHDFVVTGDRAGASDSHALDLDLGRLAAAYPRLDAAVLVQRTELALWTRHLVGSLTRSDIESLSLAPAEHPCGIDLNASGTRDLLADHGRVLTGRDVAVPLVVEWGRHRFFDWGEDEEVLFFSWDRPALEAALADPWCVKRDDVEGYLERL